MNTEFENRLELIKNICGYNGTISSILTNGNKNKIKILNVMYTETELKDKLSEIYETVDDLTYSKNDLLFFNILYSILKLELGFGRDYHDIGDDYSIPELKRDFKELINSVDESRDSHD